jgi:diguanylate cyclase (GGDEF)-like protein/PAS domain S-box-containing protein
MVETTNAYNVMGIFLATPWLSRGALLTVVTTIALVQQLWIYLAQRRSRKREELFRIIAENAADMIALVNVKGRRLYNSPAYSKVLGYSPAELAQTPVFEQIHPDDRFKVLEAAREARVTGVGKSLEYRLRHKNGSWRILESTASTIRNDKGEVEKLVIVNRDITERKYAEDQLAHHALHDALTDLPNRRLFLNRLQRCYSQGQRDPAFRYGVLLLNVDGFKICNNTLGTAVADQVLVEIARRLRNCHTLERAPVAANEKAVIGEVLLSRLGGDEFGILLERAADPNDAMRLANRIQTEFASPMALNGHEICITASIGIALSAKNQEHAEVVLRDAEDAMRRAKGMGGARSELLDSALHTRAVNRLQMEIDLRAALDQNQFKVHYQPIFQIENRRVVSFEALVRWQHPEQGLISPYKFMEAAEDTGLIALIDKWVIWQACQQMYDWQSRYPFVKPLCIAVNISGRHLTNPHLASEIKACIRTTGIEASRLQLEVSEAIAATNPELTYTVLAQLNRLEVATAIDDFGTGRVRIMDLRRFPIDTLKIDRSLVNNLLSDRISHDAVDLILTLASKLNTRVVAEGVEKAAQIELLRSMGCKFGQGYLFSPPLEAQQAEDLIRQQSLTTRAMSARGEKS